MAEKIDPGRDYNRPTLEMTRGWLHHYTGTPDVPAGGAGSKQNKPPDNGRFHVNLASMLAAERAIGASIESATVDYNSLKTYLNDVAPSNDPWIFASKRSGQTGGITSGGGGSGGNSSYTAGWTFADPPKNKTDGSENILDPKVQALLHQQDRLLVAVADAIAYAGAFVYAIDQAGQVYSKADKESFVNVEDYTITP